MPVDEQMLLDRSCSLHDGPMHASMSMTDRHVLRELPNVVHLAELRRSRNGSTAERRRAGDTGSALVIGRRFDDLEPATLHIAGGEHLLVLGPSRSGRSTALRTIAHAWRADHPLGTVVSIARRRSSVREGTVIATVDQLPPLLDDGDTLIVVDDAELVDDPSRVLAGIIEAGARVSRSSPRAGLTRYGRRTATGRQAVRRSRAGIVMAASSDLDGDLLGALLPRRCPIAPRPGLGWLIADGAVQLVQVATSPETCAPDVRQLAVPGAAASSPSGQNVGVCLGS